MGRQESRGKKKKLLGRGTQIAGIVTGDTELELEGSRLYAEGEAQERASAARRERGKLAGGAARRR